MASLDSTHSLAMGIDWKKIVLTAGVSAASIAVFLYLKTQGTLVDRKKKDDKVSVNDVDELKDLLEGSGIDTSQFGVGEAKTLKALLKELGEGSCALERQEDGSVLRVVEPVFVQLLRKDKVLVNTYQDLEDGRQRKRFMLLAEKKEPADTGDTTKTLLKKEANLQQMAPPFDTSVRGIEEEIHIPLDAMLKDGVIKLRADLYKSDVEVTSSSSYPGLKSAYRNHYTAIEILDDGVQTFGSCGLPAMESFSTAETTKLGTKTQHWEWWPCPRAKEEKVKGMPK